MVKLIDLTTKDTKNHEKNIGRRITQIKAYVKSKRLETRSGLNSSEFGKNAVDRGKNTITDRIKIFNLASGVHTEF